MNLINGYNYTMKWQKNSTTSTLQPQPHSNIQHNQLLTSIKNKLQPLYPNNIFFIINSQRGQIEHSQECKYNQVSSLLMITSELSFQTYQFYLQIRVQKQIEETFIIGKYLKNGIPISISSKQKRIMAIRRINNINRQIRPIRIVMNPFSGQISLQNCSFINPDYLGKAKYKNIIGVANKITNIILILLDYKLVLLYILQQMPDRIEYCRQKLSIFQFATNHQQHLHMIENRLDQLCLQTFNQQLQLSDHKRMQQVKRQTSFLSDDINGIISQFKIDLYSGKNKLKKLSNDQYTSNSLKEFFYVQQYKRLRIFNKIVFDEDGQNVVQWKQITKGGFGVIYQSNVAFHLLKDYDKDLINCIKKNKQDRFCQTIVKKSDKRKQGLGQNRRVKKQLELLRNLEGTYHPNILIFFQNVSERNEHNQYIYSMYQENLSIQAFLQNHKIISMIQKIFMMEQVSKGLFFLHRHNIAHIDIKPDNLLVGRRHIIKIADFGSSQLISDLGQKQNFAYTFPYAPPEIYIKHHSKINNNYRELSQAIDVYELGVTIFKTLFGDHIWGNHFKKKQMIERMKRGSIILAGVMPEMMLYYGDKRVMHLLTYLCLRCVENNPNNRPSMAWIITILQECRNYLEKLSYR